MKLKQVFIFIGPTNIGKSTLRSLMYYPRYVHIVDDFVPIKENIDKEFKYLEQNTEDCQYAIFFIKDIYLLGNLLDKVHTYTDNVTVCEMKKG